MTDQLFEYLRVLRIPVSKTFLNKALLAHPDYPSLLSVSDVLERLAIKANIGHVREGNINEVGFPFLLYSAEHSPEFTQIKNKKDFEAIKNRVDFARDIILKAEPKDNIQDKEHQSAYVKDQFFKRITQISLLGTILYLGVVSVLSFHLPAIVFLITVLAGLGVGYVLVAKEVGVTYKAVEDFCGAGKHAGCNAVLNSEGAKLFNRISLSELVMSYFSTQLLIVLFLFPYEALGASYMAVFAIANVLNVPIIGYSLYYQIIKAKSWCKLCLVVIGVLAAQLLLFSSGYVQSWFELSDLNTISVISSVMLFVGTGLGVIFVTDTIRTSKESLQGETSALRLKHTPEVFTHLLQQQRSVEVSFFEKELLLGNALAPIRITMASNMFCNPCKTMHQRLAELVAIYPSNICVSVRFLPVHIPKQDDKESTNPREYLFSYWLDQVFGKENESLRTESMINDWFDTKDLARFSEKYALSKEIGDNLEIKELLDKHDTWVTQARITHTPTIFLNGFEMPQNYTINDLKAMIPGLMEVLPRLDISSEKVVQHPA